MRKKFTFSLQAVLEHRKRLEDAALQAVAVRQRACDDAVRKCDRLAEEIRGVSEIPNPDYVAIAADLLLYDAHVQFLDRSLEAQRCILAERHAELESVRQAAIAASTHRKVIENLKNRRHAAYLAAESRLEQLEFEDANQATNARRAGHSHDE